MSDDADDESTSQPGELDAPLVVTEDDVSTDADSQNATTRRTSGVALPTADNSRPAFTPLLLKRGPKRLATVKLDLHEHQCNALSAKFASLFVYAFMLYQAYNYRGSNISIGGLASARKTQHYSVATFCSAESAQNLMEMHHRAYSLSDLR